LAPRRPKDVSAIVDINTPETMKQRQLHKIHP